MMEQIKKEKKPNTKINFILGVVCIFLSFFLNQKKNLKNKEIIFLLNIK